MRNAPFIEIIGKDVGGKSQQYRQEGKQEKNEEGFSIHLCIEIYERMNGRLK